MNVPMDTAHTGIPISIRMHPMATKDEYPIKVTLFFHPLCAPIGASFGILDPSLWLSTCDMIMAVVSL